MKMKSWMAVLLGWLIFVLPLGIVQAQESTAPLPPRFTLDENPEAVLERYPLGVINQQAAFSHHGGAHRKISLPNGETGWVYNVGEKEWHRTYTLVFDEKNTVVNVLYYDHGKHDNGLTAMQLQSRPLIVGGPRTAPGPSGQ